MSFILAFQNIQLFQSPKLLISGLFTSFNLTYLVIDVSLLKEHVKIN